MNFVKRERLGHVREPTSFLDRDRSFLQFENLPLIPEMTRRSSDVVRSRPAIVIRAFEEDIDFIGTVSFRPAVSADGSHPPASSSEAGRCHYGAFCVDGNRSGFIT